MRKARTKSTVKNDKVAGKSFFDWRKRYFPEDVKREQIEGLQRDASQLGQALADSTIDRLIRRRA